MLVLFGLDSHAELFAKIINCAVNQQTICREKGLKVDKD